MIRFYDTPSRSKRTFEPLEPGRVRLYSCGPTVWDHAHIGNFRCFLFYDVLKRYLRYRGFEVEHVMNLTDIDDRIVERVAASGRRPARSTSAPTSTPSTVSSKTLGIQPRRPLPAGH